MKTDDICYNTLRHIEKKLRKLAKNGVPGDNSDEDLNFHIEASIEDGLLAVRKMRKTRKREIEALRNVPPVGPNGTVTFLHADGTTSTHTQQTQSVLDDGPIHEGGPVVDDETAALVNAIREAGKAPDRRKGSRVRKLPKEPS